MANFTPKLPLDLYYALCLGTDLLPAPVEELYALCLNRTSLILKWATPRAGPHPQYYVTRYKKITNETLEELPINDNQVINISQCFTIYILYFGRIPTREIFQEINSTTPSVELNLVDYSIYSMYVTAHNTHGSSLPSSILVINCSKESGYRLSMYCFNWDSF